MPGYIRSLRLFAIMSLAGGLILSMMQGAIGHGAPTLAVGAAAHTSRSGSRIWYPAGHYPSLFLPGGRHEVVRSLLNITKPMHFGDFVWDEDHIPEGPLWVRVDLAHQTLSAFRGRDEVGSAVILFGANSHATPTGIFTILQKDAHYYSRSYHAPMPYMLRLTSDGVAIHGSTVREGWATHGCIGVPLGFAKLLFAAASNGDPVFIIPAK